MNENDAYVFDVEQPRDWIFTGDPVWIAGWFVSKIGAVFSDIRAVIDGVPHLGILGLPRPDIEERYRGRIGLPHAGFLLRVKPPRSARDLRIELLDAGNRWVEIWRTPIDVRQGENTVGRYNLGILPDHVHRLLQARRADPNASLAPLADQLVVEGASVPLDTLPNPPFFGALEKPELVGGVQYGKVRLEGWIIHREQRICRLLASTHPEVENEIDYGDRERPEAAALFPGHPHAGRSQYFGLLDIDEHAPGPVLIRLFAELEDGTRHLVFARRFYPRACPTWEQPLPEFDSRIFASCVLALHAAARRHRIRTGRWARRWPALRRALELYRLEAPDTALGATAEADSYTLWQRNNALSPTLRGILEAAARTETVVAKTCLVLVDTQGCTQAQVADLAASLRAQLHSAWTACFLGPTPPPPGEAHCSHQPTANRRDLATQANELIRQSSATLVTLIPGHARLAPDALLEIAELAARQPSLALIYTDEDTMDDSGQRSTPVFKPAWSPALALSGLFPGHLTFVRREQLLESGGLRPECEHVLWSDALLRVGDTLGSAQVGHVPLVCYHARAGQSVASDLSDPRFEQARCALAETAARRGIAAAPFLPEAAHLRRECFHQLRWSRELLARLPVTIVIPTRDRLHLLQECVERLEETVDWRHVRLVIVDDHSRDADAVRYLQRIQERTDLHCRVVRLPDAQAPFNYSRLVNAALPLIETPLVLHLNNDVNALEPGWLEEMVGWFTQPEVGVVGAKLIFPDRTLNHTGLIIGPHGGLADTPWARCAEQAVPSLWHAAAREVSAVTGACLLTRTDLYRELGGFDEQDFGVAYNDVDYCLRVRARGQRVIYTPQAKLMHWGSATRGVTFDEAEHIAWLDRYPGFRDPYCSRHWQLHGAALRCDPAAGARPERARPLRVLLISHNLNLEGAPLFLLEYATHLVRHAGFGIEVLACQEGPLRSNYEALGARITVLDPGPLFASRDEPAFRQRLEEIFARLDWPHLDLVVGNTLLCFWAVPLAARAGRPALLYIHESSTVFRAFEKSLALDLHPLVHAALRNASRTFFLCPATRRYYADDDRGNFQLVPSWIQLDQIQRFRTQHTRAELRRKHGLSPDEIIVANIGTVCERKGQHIFIRAIEHFNRHHPGHGQVRFLLVGARPGIYLDLLQRDIARLGLSNLTLVPETREAFDFFVLADVFVCSSYEESFPRVVMEAMAFGTPIVSTDVHGIADLIGQRQDGYLVKPGDVAGLARMIHTCLAKERSGKSLAPVARSKVRRYHDAARILPLHVDLARAAWLAHDPSPETSS